MKKTSSEKSLDEIIATIEQSVDVNAVQYRNMKIWPLLRMAIYQQLYHSEKKFTRKNYPASNKIPVIGVQKEQRELLCKYRNTDILVFSFEFSEYPEKIKGKFYYPFTDSMIDLVRDNYSFLKLEIASDRVQNTLPRFEPTIFINQTRLGYETDTVDTIEGFPDLQKIVLDIGKIKIEEALFIEQAQLVKAWQNFYTEILSEVRPKAVFFSCYYQLIVMALIRACKELSIITVDIQHGRIDNYHASYTHWTRIPPDGYELLPDYFWCWGHSSKRGIEKWHHPNNPHHHPLVGGNLNLARWVEGDDFIVDEEMINFYTRLKRKRKVVLITMAEYERPLPGYVYEAMQRSPSDWLWLIRFHPFFSDKFFIDQTLSLLRQYGVYNYEVEYANTCPLYGLLKRIDHHLTIYSSVFYEALAFRVPSTIIHPSGVEYYEHCLEKGMIAYADTSEKILASIEHGFPNPEINPAEYIETDRECAESALKTILNHSQNIKGQSMTSDDGYPINNIISQKVPLEKTIVDLINKGVSKIQNNEFQDALTTYLDKALKLAQAGQLKVQKLQYFRSICLGNMGLIDDAIAAIKQELADNPDDSQAQALYRQLQSVPEEKKKSETQYPEEFTRLIPETFAVETILGCDLKCPECAIGGDFVTRKKGWMQFDQFKIIADKIRPFCKHLYLHIWGEPMLNKDIFKMIEYASAFTSTNISTNGKSMTEEKAERLIRSGVTDIIVSIDGVSQEVYEKYRVGGRVEKAVEALKMLQHFNQKYGNKVHIMPQFIVMEHNHHEMNAFRNMTESLGLRPLFKSPYIRNPNSYFSASDDPRFQRPCYPDIASLKAAMCECESVRKAFNILLDGSVVVCCHDYGRFTHFGNIFEQDVMGIWNSEKYKKFRWNVMSGKAPKFCRERCMSYFLEHPEQALIDKHKDQALPENIDRTELNKADKLKINLCSGSIKLDGYVNVDIFPGSDIILDLEKDLLPFPDNSADIVACISAINYFSRQRALEIIKDAHRVLKPGGIARFGTQDLHILAKEYLKKDSEFYSQKLPDGRDRFPGKTVGDKFNEFFYGFQSGNKHCKYVYDFESLKVLFEDAGFSLIEQKNYQESLIPQVAQLDNRPEQMFFLEAIKDKTNSAVSNAEITRVLNEIKSSVQEGKTEPSALDSMRNQAFRLWETGEKERAWQLLLKVLELQPDDRQTALKCVEILSSLNKPEDLLKLCTDFLNLKPDDVEIRRIAENAQNQVKENSPDSNELEQRRLELRKFNQFFNAVHGDETHLSACMQWLIKAQDVNAGGGVSAAYHIDSQRWDVDYPETTGYIIPTFLCYSKLTRDESYRKRAIDMGDWEIAIQSPEGGAGEPVGVYGLRPRVFNTGQVIIGWVALYAETGDQKYLQAARKAADWIVENQDPDGKWTKSTYSGPKAYKSRVAWALLELYGVSKEEKYRIAVERSVNWIFSQASANAWFANNSLSDPGKPWTHLVGYVLVGLMEIYRLNMNNPQFKNVLSLLHHAAKNISTFYAKLKEGTQQGYFSTLPGTLDSNWSSSDNWSCVTGNAQIEFFLRRMFRYTNDPSLKSSADMLLNDLKMIHLLGNVTDPNISGGLAGSCPVGGPYLGYSIPNWGVKFFADSLLQRLLPEQEQKYLG